jgi:hypothetical protein
VTAVDRTQLDAAAYTPHALHSAERIWPETNCYVDLWIELLHSLGMDPHAMLAFTLAMDFECDQWTFFKPPFSDLYSLYGIDVQELTVWRSLPLQIEDQVTAGRGVLVEVDAFFLPDTAGVSYGLEHTKTTVAIREIDLSRRTVGYFHNAGYFTLASDDFDGLFRNTSAAPGKDAPLSPFVETAKLERAVRRSDAELVEMAHQLAARHVRRRPDVNPVTRYRARFADDMSWLRGQEMSVFHQYAFATLRQCGACAELAAAFLTWMGAGSGYVIPAAGHFNTIATTAKALQFKVARMVATGKPIDFTPMLDTMEGAWESAMADLVPRYAG